MSSSSSPSSSASPGTAPIAWAAHMTAALGVSEIDRSIAWYRDVLGFELIYKLDDWGWAELRSPIADVSVGIGQTEDLEPRGGATLTFGVVDIAAARASLEARDVRFDGETTEVPGMVRLATFYDPDGNTFMLAQQLDVPEARDG
jgi:catechol 2,3-dioxygenase-like lactoylglutathione lyase family enzyme